MAEEQKIETLLAEAGKKFEEDGQAIASYGSSRRPQIVFLPKGCEPGKKYRVKLLELREDARGRMMYRAVPAEDEYTERWKDLGNGTASRVTIAIDWQLQESEVGTMETRKLEAREGSPSTQSNLQIVWGVDLATSRIEDRQVSLIPLEEEKVEGGQLVWRKTGERSEPLPVLTFPISRLGINGFCDWYRNRLLTNYDPTDKVTVIATFHSWEQSHSHQATWQEMPKWWQAEQEARYPLCSCGRQRYDSQNPDGYLKCEECRKEEVCLRCGKQTKITVINGRLICSACQPCEEQEGLIGKFLPPDQRQRIAEEAKNLLAGQALTKEEGEMVLKATMDHLTSSWDKDRLVEKWSGYGWYYFCNQGVFGCKLAPAALQILQYLPQASGNGLVEMVAWLTGGAKPRDESADFYLRTQVKGEAGVEPAITGDLLKQIKVADCLRGSEPDRQAALRGYQNLVAALGEEAEESKAVAEILQSNEQDYANALGWLAEYQRCQAERQAQAAAGEIWLEVEIPVSTESRTHDTVRAINPDGSVLDPQKKDTGGRKARVCAYCYGDLTTDVLVIKHSHDNYGYRLSESWEVCYFPQTLTPAQKSAARQFEQETRQYFAGPGASFDLTKKGQVAFTTEYSRDLNGDRRQTYEELTSQLPIQVSQWKTTLATGEEEGASEPGQIIVWAEEAFFSEEERKLREDLRVLESRFDSISRELRDCESDYPSRVKLTFQLDAERGTLFAIANVCELSVQELRSGEWQKLTGPVRFVCDPQRCRWLETPPASGEIWVSSWGKMIGRDNKSRPIIIANPQMKIDSAILAEIDKIKAEIALTKNSPTPEIETIEGSDNISSLEDLKKKFQR